MSAINAIVSDLGVCCGCGEVPATEYLPPVRKGHRPRNPDLFCAACAQANLDLTEFVDTMERAASTRGLPMPQPRTMRHDPPCLMTRGAGVCTCPPAAIARAA